MTTIYFIRHATPDRSVGEDATYPLNEKGLADVALVTAFLRGKNIDAVLSSPFKRAMDTVADFAEEAGLSIELIDDFRERAVTKKALHLEKDEFTAYRVAQWADFSYRFQDGDSLAEVQSRNLAALKDVLTRYEGKNIVIGTHGTALSTIIHHYEPTYGYAGYMAMVDIMPWVAKMTFDEQVCTAIEKIDLFNNEKV